MDWQLGRIALAVLSTDPTPAGDDLLETIEHAAAHASEEAFDLVVGGFGARHPAAMTLEVLDRRRTRLSPFDQMKINNRLGVLNGGKHRVT